MSKSERVPHYQMETFSSTAPEYLNTQQDIIRQGFHTGNYTWLKESLPVELGHDTILAVKRLRIEKGRGAVDPGKPQKTWARMSSLWGGGYYPEFKFMPEPYDGALQAEREDKKQSLRKREAVSARGWQPNSHGVRLDYEPMVVTRDEMGDARKKEPFPRLAPGIDVHEAGPAPYVEPFYVGGRSQVLNDDRQQKGRLPTAIRLIQQRLDADWADCTIVVTANEQDLVQVAFYEATLDSERGALAYMNILLRQDLCCELGLRKVPQLWGRKRDFREELDALGEASDEPATWLVFMLAPSWVKMRLTDAVYTLYPREASVAEGSYSAYKMSEAGKSIMQALHSTSMTQGSTMTGGPSLITAGPSLLTAGPSTELPPASARGNTQQSQKLPIDSLEAAASQSAR
jgi:hypothetical protein